MMRVVFLGSGEFAVPSLARLHESGFEISLVISQPDRPRGRGRALHPTPVKQRALELGLPVECPERIREEAIHETVGGIAPRAIVVAAYGQKIPRSFLDLAGLTSVNVHGSLLPRHRGASPVAGSLLSGDPETGVTIQLVADEIDAGDIVLQDTCTIEESDNADILEARLARMGADLLVKALAGLDSGEIVPVPQDHSLATLTRKLKKSQGRIPWTGDATAVVRHIQAFTPWPGAFSTVTQGATGSSEKLILRRASAISDTPPATPGRIIDVDKESFTVACGTGALRVLEVQRSGKRPLDTASFLRGFPLQKDDRFETETEQAVRQDGTT